MLDLTDVQGVRNAVHNIRPSGMDAYPDTLHIWLINPLTVVDQDLLFQHCRGPSFYDDGWYPRHPKTPWPPRGYRFFLQLRQPDREALLWLARRNDVLLKRVDFALDWTFDNQTECDRADELVARHYIKQHHGKQRSHIYEGTYYSSRWRVANEFVGYADKPSRVTGEVYCKHNEWRLTGLQALRRSGIGSVKDLLSWDHRQFWRRRLLLRTVDNVKLGRRYRMHVQGIKERGQRAADGRIGARIAATASCMQDLVDRYRRHFRVNECLVAIDVEHLLADSVEVEERRSRSQIDATIGLHQAPQQGPRMDPRWGPQRGRRASDRGWR
jgi:hypothetical protein